MRETWIAALAIGLAGCASAPVLSISEFENARTKGELTRFMGTYAGRCLPTRPGFQLCKWEVGDRYQSWETLARAIGTSRRVTVICELPSDGGPRGPDSCGIYARESHDYSGGREQALRALEEARTLAALSSLVGDLPHSCREEVPGTRTCIWRVSNREAGYGLLAAAADANGQLRLVCEIPVDGGPRAAGSCRAAPIP
jgi:hypothetical protein